MTKHFKHLKKHAGNTSSAVPFNEARNACNLAYNQAIEDMLEKYPKKFNELQLKDINYSLKKRHIY